MQQRCVLLQLLEPPWAQKTPRKSVGEALHTTKEAFAFSVFESAFKEFGLPRAIRTDNGVPFASPNALFGLSRLSVWWLRLGIEIERIKSGNPQQNGRHERMHLTLKLEATKPAARNFLQQQARFDDFIDCYNNERPHQALNMQCPAQHYVPSRRIYQGLPDLDYPFHDRTATVTTCGRICFNRQKINLSVVFAGQNVGIKQVSDRIWLVTFMDYDLGYFDDETCRSRTDQRPVRPKGVTYIPGMKRNPCVRNGPIALWRAGQNKTANSYVIEIAL